MTSLAETPEAARGSAAVKSADRALIIVELVSARGSVRFNDITEILRIPQSSAHALLQTLMGRKWLDYDAETRRYSLGLHVWQIGQTYTGNGDLVAVAKPVMDRLAEELGETVQLARLDGAENVYLAISESSRPMRIASTVGARLPAHATGIGKALLSQLPPEISAKRLRLAELIACTPRTVTDPRQLDRIIDDVRRSGFATDYEEVLMGCCCVAVPLLDDGKGGITALSVTTTTGSAGPDWPQNELDLLQAAAAVIRTRAASTVL